MFIPIPMLFAAVLVIVGGVLLYAWFAVMDAIIWDDRYREKMPTGDCFIHDPEPCPMCGGSGKFYREPRVVRFDDPKAEKWSKPDPRIHSAFDVRRFTQTNHCGEFCEKTGTCQHTRGRLRRECGCDHDSHDDPEGDFGFLAGG